MNVLIIPARMGSKRIKKKNIKLFLGKPIINLLLKKIIDMNFFNSIYISTESKTIKSVVKKFDKKNICQIIDRPKKLSDDFTGTRDVILHAIKALKLDKKTTLFCVYPTSVFLKKNNLNDSLKILKFNKKSYIFSAKKIDQNFFRGFFFSKNKIDLIFNSNYSKRTQELKNAYVDAAQFYLATVDTWIKNKKIFSQNSKFILLDKNASSDIDDISDWKLAESLYKKIEK